MSRRTHAFWSVAVLAVIATAACDRSGTRDATVTTTSPAGESTAPSAAVAAERDEALVRVVHAHPSGASVDVLADETTLFDGVEYAAVTEYRSIEGQRYELQLRPAGMAGADDTLVDGVDVRSVTSYHEIDPIQGTAVQGRTEDHDAVIATVTHAQVAAGRFYTLVVTGPGATGPFEAYLIEDVLHPSTNTAGTNR